MSEIIKVINKPSHNFFADQVVRTLGMVVKNEGSFDAGTAVVREWLEKIKAPQLNAYQMFDGSGLAADNFIQPQQMCHVLRYMRNSPKLGKIFFESLPIGGKESGLRKRMQWDCTKGNVHCENGLHIQRALTLRIRYRCRWRGTCFFNDLQQVRRIHERS